MSSALYKAIRVLIVDDFNNFRTSLNKIMNDLGCLDVENASTGEQALSFCHKHHYDVILCYYNLGSGKNGQQLLEELRVNRLLMPQDIFILLSAETSRNVVMSTYDYEPDAYLTKPFTTKVIQQRLNRLMTKRAAMLPIYIQLVKGRKDDAIQILQSVMESSARYSMDCQKLLADLYLEGDQFDQAEAVYRSVLDVRALN